MNKSMTIGMMGLTFLSANKGCAALAYSFLYLLESTAKKNGIKINLKIFSHMDMPNLHICDETIISCEIIEYHFSNLKSQILCRKKIKECDYVFDFTEGDSFSDIYGIKQLVVNSNLKLICINRKIPLILGPQTIGPYTKSISRTIAKRIIKNCNQLYTRDLLSTEYVKELTGRECDTLIDIAFALPYSKSSKKEKEKIVIGINISGLLWNNGYTGNNEFNLTVNYKEYILKLIEYLIGEKRYELHIIPHVIIDEKNAKEDDYRVSEKICNEYKDCILSPKFETPMEAKSYIASMDIFCGARMHADIAAFSSGVPVIPFSYSRKFEGLFGTLNYPYTVKGKELSTDQALDETIGYINIYETLKTNMIEGLNIANEKLDVLKAYLDSIIN